MNLAVRRRLSDLRTMLLGANSPSKKRQVQKNRDEVRKMSRLHGMLLINAKFRPKTRKKPCEMQGIWS